MKAETGKRKHILWGCRNVLRT